MRLLVTNNTNILWSDCYDPNHSILLNLKCTKNTVALIVIKSIAGESETLWADPYTCIYENNTDNDFVLDTADFLVTNSWWLRSVRLFIPSPMLGTFETKYSEAIITLIIVLLDSYKLIYADAIYNLFTISYTKTNSRIDRNQNHSWHITQMKWGRTDYNPHTLE